MSNAAMNEPKEAPGAYKVGYKCPPKQSQFKKGVSGNPKGRPKRKPNNERLYEEPTKRLAHREAYRTITVREGEKTIKMPAVQAVLGVLRNKALKGDIRAAREYLKLVIGVETERREEQIEDIKTVIGYKQRARKVREQCAEAGVPAPEFVPNPDDIEIDTKNGSFAVNGACTPEEKEARQKIEELRKGYEEDLAWIKAELTKTPDDEWLQKDQASLEKCIGRLKALDQ